MKKVININFQGRVIPIEDSAYDLLQQYITSLRTYFAKEEGRDEIINDIESRIGELFEEQLKKGAACITDEHVTAVMDSMGRPADFEKADEPDTTTTSANGNTYTNTSTGAANTNTAYEFTADNVKGRRLFRDEQDKILGGVASGLANYFNLDPAIVRILFAISVFLGGAGFLLYVVLWIALPSKSLVNNIRKRLYRDTDDRIFKGVCGGLAKYFDINPIIPRIIFAAPFIFGLITTLGRNFFFQGPVFIGGFSGGSFILAYIILWAVLPEAVTASEKLEMKGEKVDLNSIRNTIMEDMQGFKGRAEKVKTDVQESTARVMKNTKTAWENQGRPFVNEATGNIRRRSGGLGHAIGVLLKAFIMIIGGIIAFGLVVGLIALLSTGIGRMELTDFVLNGFWQKVFGWGVILLFIGAPILAIAISIIRRMMRTKGNGGRYISYTFSALWLIGLFCLIALIGLLTKDFRYEQTAINDVAISQPVSGKLSLKMGSNSMGSNTEDWFNWDGALFIENDSLYLNNIKINVIRSLDDDYHIHVVRMSDGGSRNAASQRTEKLNFEVTQVDDVVYFPENISIGVADKWRNQRVLVVVEVPVGKIINVGSDLNAYNYFNVYSDRRRNRTIENRWYNDQTWNSDKDMRQTRDDLERADHKQDDEENNDDNDLRHEAPPHNVPTPVRPIPTDSIPRPDTAYRYPTSTTYITPVEKKKAKRTYNTLALSPLASILW